MIVNNFMKVYNSLYFDICYIPVKTSSRGACPSVAPEDSRTLASLSSLPLSVLTPLVMAQAATNLLSESIDMFAFSSILYTRSHTVGTVFCLVSFTKHGYVEIHP